MLNKSVHISNASMTSSARNAIVRRPVEPRPDRKLAILLAAEKLFAVYGYHAVSLRQIANEAQVPLALVNYYFGQKHELFYAIFDHWRSTIDARLAALEAVDSDSTDPATLERIVRAFVEPVLSLRASPEGEYYALLVARELSYAIEEADTVLREHFDPLARAFIDAIERAMPGAKREQVAWGYQFALGALLYHLSDKRIERLSDGRNRANDPAAGTSLISFIVGGLRATLPTASRAKRNTRPRSQ